MNATCRDCPRELRSSHSAPTEGTVRHEGYGYCGRCYRRHQRAGTLPSPDRSEPRGVTIVGPCERCGRVRSYKPDRPNSEVCSSCRQVLNHPEPIDETDALETGRWVPNGRGTLVWREDVAA